MTFLLTFQMIFFNQLLQLVPATSFPHLLFLGVSQKKVSLNTTNPPVSQLILVGISISKRQLEFVHQVLPAQGFELQHEIVHSLVQKIGSFRAL